MHDTECFHTHSKNPRPAPPCDFGRYPQICMKALFDEKHLKTSGVCGLLRVAAMFNENFIHELSVVAENIIEIDSCKYSKERDSGDVTFYRCVNSSIITYKTLCSAKAASKNVDGRIVGLASPYDIHTCNLRYRRKIPRIPLNSEVSTSPLGKDFVASDQLPSTSTDFVQRPTSTSTDFVESDQRQIPEIALNSEVSILPSGNVNTFYRQSIKDDEIKLIIATLKKDIEGKDEMAYIRINKLCYICERDDAPIKDLISYGLVQICLDL